MPRKKREAMIPRRRCFEGGDCHSNRLEIIQRAPLGPGSILGARSKMAPHEYIIVAIARVAAG